MAVRREQLFGDNEARIYSFPAQGGGARRRRFFVRRLLAATVVAASFSGAALALASLGEAVPGAPGPRARPGAPGAVVVGSGETLWDLAHRFAPGEDPRAYVGEVVELNRLGGGTVQAGMRLRLPR